MTKVRLTNETRDNIYRMRRGGLTVEKIMRATGCSEYQVEKVLKNYGLCGCATEDDREWIRKNWGKWYIPEKPKIKFRNGYRVVHVGDMGHLRTPYRPDGIFR